MLAILKGLNIPESHCPTKVGAPAIMIPLWKMTGQTSRYAEVLVIFIPGDVMNK
jgi:hypothetical protein